MKDLGTRTLETERLILRKFALDDVEAVFKNWGSDLNVTKYVSCEIGYVYGSKFWGNGYATEALRKVLEYLLVDCDFHLVEATHYESNLASGKVMEKAGMIKDGVLRERRLKKNSEEYDNLVVYSMTKSDL